MSVGMRLCLCVVFNVVAVVSLGDWVSASENVRLRQPPPWDSNHRVSVPRPVTPRETNHEPIWLSYRSEPAAAHANPAAAIANSGSVVRAAQAARDDTIDGEVFGLNQRQIEAAFGEPAWTLERSPATETFFREGECTLGVTLYPDVQTRVFRALAYEVTSDADTVEGMRFCSDLFASRLVASK